MKVVKFKNKLETQSHKRQRTNSDRQKRATHTEYEHGLDANQSSSSQQITTGKGLCVPICEGEEIVSIY